MGISTGGVGRGRVEALDGLRGVAALSVIAYHYIFIQTNAPIGSLFYYLRAPLKFAWSGVDLFFVLSGFLITDILIKSRGSPNYFETFYARRITRIFPVYFLVLLSFFAAKTVLPDNLVIVANPMPWWSYVLFVQNIPMWLSNDTSGALWLAPTWSLAVEEQFYLFVPLIVLWLPRRPAIALLICLAGMAPILRHLYPSTTAFMMTPFRTDSLLFGSLLAYAIQNPRFLQLCRARVGLLYAVLGILAAGIPVMMVRREWFEPFDFTWLSTFYLMLILLVQVSPFGLLAKLFRSKVLLWFGLMSYAIYMFHEAVLGLCQYLLLGSNSGGIHAPIDAAVTVLAFAVTCALAALSARFFEGPIRKFGHRWKY